MDSKPPSIARLVPSRSRELLVECRKLAGQRLPTSLETALDHADDAFFELANKADNSQRQNLYFDAMRELRLKRSELEENFLSIFNDSFDSRIDQNQKTMPKAAAFAPVLELSLVESDELEESLAETNFITSIKTKCKEQLFGINKRIGYLLSEPELLDDDNPLGPNAIGAAFKAACGTLEADIEVKITLFKLFDKYACHSIDDMYRTLNDHLVSRDILPTIITSRPTTSSNRRTRVIIEDCDERTEATGPDVFSTLQTLMESGAGALSGLRNPISGMGAGALGSSPAQSGGIGGGVGVGGGVGGNADGALNALSGTHGPTIINTSNLVDTLTMFQHGDLSAIADAQACTLNEAQLHAGTVNVLRELKTTGAIGQINQTDDLTLDIVSILFDYVLDDPAIPDSMKALIGRLQIPLLKVALLDKALFTKKAHPARRLLDALATAAVGWSETSYGKDDLYSVVERIVRTITDKFDDDVAIFETALEELETYLAKEQVEADQRTEESTRSLRTREQVVLAKLAVDDAINARIAGQELRAFLRQFLLEYWRQLMIITHVENGEGSEQWNGHLATVDDLIWSVQEKSSTKDRKGLTEKLPALLKKVKRGMATLEMEPKTCSKFMSMLASVHVVSVKQNEEASLAERHLFKDSAIDEPLSEEQTNNEEFLKQSLAKIFEQKGVDVEEIEEINFDLSAFDDDILPPSDPGQLSPNIMEYVEQVTELDLGDWVEFVNHDDTTTRARFTWISPATGRYLFTTRQGERAVDTTLTGLADQFARNAARRVETRPDPIFERAIGDLMDRLEGRAA